MPNPGREAEGDPIPAGTLRYDFSVPEDQDPGKRDPNDGTRGKADTRTDAHERGDSYKAHMRARRPSTVPRRAPRLVDLGCLRTAVLASAAEVRRCLTGEQRGASQGSTTGMYPSRTEPLVAFLRDSTDSTAGAATIWDTTWARVLEARRGECLRERDDRQCLSSVSLQWDYGR